MTEKNKNDNYITVSKSDHERYIRDNHVAITRCVETLKDLRKIQETITERIRQLEVIVGSNRGESDQEILDRTGFKID